MQETYSPKALVHRLQRLSSMLLAIFFTSGMCAAQIDRAALTGTVTDATGAVIQQAQVQAVELATGLKSEAQTNSKGVYLVPGLAIGTYSVTISHQGFGTLSFQNVLLEVGLTRVLNAQLRVSVPGERIHVEAAQPLEQTSPEVSGVITEQQIQEIPINGRNWATLLVLAPGAIDDGGGDQRTIRFAGRGRDDNNYMIDGVDATGIQEQAQKSTTRLQISEDAVSEYRVSSSLYTAEYGAGAGGQVNIETKSGTNVYHGSIYEYFRNNVLDARSFIDFDPFGNPVRPPFRMNQYGFSLGGPIKRNKTFFFLNYEGLRQLEDFTQAGFVPSTPLRAAVLAQSPQMAPIIAAYPRGNTNFGVCNNPANDPCVDEFIHEAPNVVNEDSFLVRVDHQISENTSFYARAQRDVSFSKAPLGAPNALLDTQQVITHPANYMLALSHSFSPRLFNEFKFGVNRAPFHNPQVSILPYDVTLDSGQFTELFNNNTDNEVGTSLGWIDNLSLTHGRHTFKTGIEVRRVRLNQGITADNNYTFAVGPTGALNAGLINDQVSSVAFRASWCCHGLRHTFVLPYFQDEWKLRPNITLNLGIRWEYYSVITEAHDRMTIFDPSCAGGVLPGTNTPVPNICPKGSPAYFPNYRNFDPRVGVSWAPSAFHDNTVVRAGFGIYHGAGQNDDLNASLESDTTRINITNVEDPTLAYPFNPNQFAAEQFLSPRALARHRRDLYVEDWGLSVQQLLPHEFTFQAGYLGTHGVRLFARNFINQCEQFDSVLFNPSDPSSPIPNCTRPYPNFGEIDIKRDAGTSHFDALQLSLQKKFSQGWMLNTQYMWSNSRNDGSVGGGEANAPENKNCLRCDYGPSVFDVRHNLVVASSYELPFGPGKSFLQVDGAIGKVVGGWSLTGLGVFHTGHPLTVTIGLDPTAVPYGDSRATQRPDIVPGVPIVPPNQNPNNWVNIAAFAQPPQDANGVDIHFGDARNGIVRAPNVWEADIALQKSTKVSEKVAVEFRAEAFNIFNHRQLGDPSHLDILSTSNFGQIDTPVSFNTNNDNFVEPATGLGLPRNLQLSFRVRF